MLKLKKKVS